MNHPETKAAPPAVSVPPVRLTLLPFDRNFKSFLAVVILCNSSDAFLILKAREAGIPVFLIPLLWLFFHGVKSLSATPGGMLSDILGRKKLILTGWVLYSLVYFGFAMADTALAIWVLFGIYGLFYGLTEGGERAWVADRVKPHLRGTAYGLYNFSIGIGALPASLALGFLWQKCGPQTLLWFRSDLGPSRRRLALVFRYRTSPKGDGKSPGLIPRSDLVFCKIRQTCKANCNYQNENLDWK
jgi:MFS family permease